jgi:hypothetical protein
MHVQLVTWRGHLKQGQQGAATLVGRVQGLPTPPPRPDPEPQFMVPARKAYQGQGCCDSFKLLFWVESLRMSVEVTA